MRAMGPSVKAALEVGTCQAVLLANRQVQDSPRDTEQGPVKDAVGGES